MQDLLLMLLNDCIDCKEISFFHVLTFCIEQDFLLMLLDSCIFHKDILLLHVLPLSVAQDVFLMLLDGCKAHKYIGFLHVLLFCARLTFVVALKLHCPQGYLTPSCTALFRSGRLPLDVA